MHQKHEKNKLQVFTKSVPRIIIIVTLEVYKKGESNDLLYPLSISSQMKIYAQSSTSSTSTTTPITDLVPKHVGKTVLVTMNLGI